MFKHLQKNTGFKFIIAAMLSFALVFTVLKFSTVYAETENSDVTEEEITETLEQENVEETEETSEATSVELDIDFTSEEEVAAAFKQFLAEFDSLSESEIQGYINEFLLFLDAEQTVNSQLEMFNVLSFEEAELSPLVHFMESHKESVDQSFVEEFEALTPELDTDQYSVFSNDVSTSSSVMNSVNRISGKTRFDTAAEISKNGWKTSQTVIIANSHNFADALAGVPLAVNMNAPILLTRTDKLEDATIKEIQRLGAKNAIILGGEVAVSKSVENKLSQLGLSNRRFAGKTRYDTAAVIADEIRSRTKSSEAFLVSGEDFADAMSIAAIAGRRGAPIYLTRSKALAEQPKKMAKQINMWYVVGGVDAISKSSTDTLHNSGARSQKRFPGVSRYDTNIRVLDYFGIPNSAYVATGRDFVDALTGSVLAGKNGTGVVLVNEVESNMTSAMSFTRNNKVKNYTLFGGEAVLPSEVVDLFKYERLGGRKPIIVIDPGHGGNFFGSVYGVAEKTLNLDTSKRLQTKLRNTGKYEVVMTRETDKHFSTVLATDLNYRSTLANNLKADIFISVHYNAGPTGSRGLETFVHHPTYPAQARRDQLNISNPRIKQSRDLADSVQNTMVQRTGMVNRGVKGLDLNVLRKTQMPAILVELGFMSDANELKKVRTNSYQDTITTAITDGINKYFGN